MRKVCFLLICSLSLVGAFGVAAQKPTKAEAETEREIRAFYDSYAEDLRGGRRVAIAGRYDERGYYRMGAGGKELISFEETKKVYLSSQWSPPKSFAWRELSVDVLAKDSALVTALFDWQTADGVTYKFSYTGVLTKRAGKWRIRAEDENRSPNLYAIEPVSGNRSAAAPFKYIVRAQPTASVGAHRHSVDLRLTVKSGRQFVLLGDLENARLQTIEPGMTLLIPANTWHAEWWETETVVEVEGTGPMRTENATPDTPRKP